MSEKLKEKKLDTYVAHKHPNKPNVVENPLLSASVANFDGLPNVPLILPAAPPQLSLPAYIPPLKEPKSLVTVGESSDIDTESLDEINLNAAPIEDLGPPAIIEPNSNSLLDQAIVNDSLLSQAASSFSALPSVASSVFSTFSKRIYAGGSREATPNFDQDFNANPNAGDVAPFDLHQGADPTQAQPFYAPPPVPPQAASAAESTFNPIQTTLPEAPIPEPPKFYAPTEVPSLPAAAVPPPPGGAAQNTYRLAAKKKLYAPIPGLSEQAQPVATLSAVTNAPPPPPSPFQQQHSPPPEERKAGGLFSLSNLVPTGVLQNISGLVQTATGTLSQSGKPETPTPIFAGSDQGQQPQIAVGGEPTNYEANFFAPPPSGFNSVASPFQPQPTIPHQPPPPPTTATEAPIHFFNPTSSPSPPQPAAVPPPSGSGDASPFPQTPKPPVESVAGFFNSPPPTQSLATQPPPPPSTGQTSFRLQKGTRLYKSPLEVAETAPVFANPPPTFFNPFAAAASTTENVPSASSVLGSTPAPTPFKPVQEGPLVEKSPTFEPFLQQTSEPPNLSTPTSTPSTQPPNFSTPTPTPSTQPPNLSTPTPTPSTQPTNLSTPTPTPSTQPPIERAVIDNPPTQLESNFAPPKPTTTASEGERPSSSPFPAFPQPPTQSINSNPEVAQNTIASSFSDLSLGPPQPTTTHTAPLLPPPSTSTTSGSINPYRRGIPTPSSTGPCLASFFTPTPSVDQRIVGDFSESVQQRFQPQQELQQQPAAQLVNQTQHPPPPLPPSTFDAPFTSGGASSISNFFGVSTNEVQQPQQQQQSGEKDSTNSSSSDFPFLPNYCTPTAPVANEDEATNAASIPPPFGFANKDPEQPQQPTFSNFFAQQQQRPSTAPKLPTQPINFFDNFGAPSNPVDRPTVGIEINDSSNSSEDQVLQNFFNNPPPKENSSEAGDLNYDLVHSGLGVRKTHTGSLTAASNVVEPPSSACSEFSELNNSSASQRERVLLSQSLGGSVENSDSATPIPTQTLIKPPVEATLHEEHPSSEELHLLRELHKDLPEDLLQEMANFLTSDKGAAFSPPPASVAYSPAVKHWFYKRSAGNKKIWTPFSHYDSALLETSFTSADAASPSNVVAVEGGRYDVNIAERLKRPVYWEGEPIEVRRCSWFFKASDSKYVPYEEDVAQYLEEEYKRAAESGVWHKNVAIGSSEHVVFHGPTVMVHFQQLVSTDNWGGSTQPTTSRPRVVKRDLDDFTIEQGESQRVDHLLLMVHGIGWACDLKLRPVEEVVDDFRSIAQQLVQSHYKNSTDMGIVGRVEVLPISWHGHLHSEEMGIDEKLKAITLESIPKLRNFTNDTLLDVLFYTSPTYCQKIITTVATAMNTVYTRYRERHPEFTGGVSLAGHSLGSLILFDLLCHQQPAKESEEKNVENPNAVFPTSDSTWSNQTPTADVTSQLISYTLGPAGTGQPFIQYAQLVFHPKKFFALGSPIGMFVTIRGIDKLGLDFRLPTCPGFYNIFHPFDLVAYRIEALVNPDMSGIRPVLIPHHKGRKRMHLELKETMARVGADLKQRFLDTFKTTLDSVNFLGSTRSKKEAEESMEKEVDQVLALQMQMDTAEQDTSAAELPTTSNRSRANSNSTVNSDIDLVEVDFPLGKLNDSKRIDYVLQEAPLEFFNEYLFALSSHVCYWDSSDTILFVMKEIYSGMGISPDSQVPQQTMTIERPSSRNSVSQSILPPTN